MFRAARQMLCGLLIMPGLLFPAPGLALDNLLPRLMAALLCSLAPGSVALVQHGPSYPVPSVLPCCWPRYRLGLLCPWSARQMPWLLSRLG